MTALAQALRHWEQREALKQADAAWLRMEGVKDEDAPLFYEGFEAGVKAALAAREEPIK